MQARKWRVSSKRVSSEIIEKAVLAAREIPVLRVSGLGFCCGFRVVSQGFRRRMAPCLGSSVLQLHFPVYRQWPWI